MESLIGVLHNKLNTFILISKHAWRWEAQCRFRFQNCARTRTKLNNKSGYIHLSLHALTAQGTILFFDCSPAKQIFQQFIIVQQSTSYRWVGMPTKLKLKSGTSKVVDNILKHFKGLIWYKFKMMNYAIYLFIDKHSRVGLRYHYILCSCILCSLVR